MANAKSVGSACNNSNASIKFDFPDPFGPISTFSGVSSITSAFGGNDKRPESFSDFMSMFTLLDKKLRYFAMSFIRGSRYSTVLFMLASAGYSSSGIWMR